MAVSWQTLGQADIQKVAAKKHYLRMGMTMTVVTGAITAPGYSSVAVQLRSNGWSGETRNYSGSTIPAGTTFTATHDTPLGFAGTVVFFDAACESGSVRSISATYVYTTKADPSITCSIRGGYLRPDQANTFVFTSNRVAGIDEQYTVKSGVFYYKLAAASSYTSIPFTGDTLELPANTLATGNTYNAYAVITVDDDTTVNVTFNDISTVDATPTVSPISPVNEVVYGTAAFRWNYSISTGTPQKAFDLQTSADGSTWSTLANHVEQDETTYTADISTSGTVYWQVRGYNQDNVASAWSESATFINNMPPDAPTITSVSATGRPLITWASGDQIAYQVQILLGGEVIEDSGAVYSGESSYQVAEYLPDNTYSIKVRVYNQYGLISDWAETEYTEAGGVTPPEFVVTSTESGALIQITTEPGMTYYIKRNGVTIATTSGAYLDRFASGPTAYTVIAVTSQDMDAMSTQTVNVEVPSNRLIDPDGTVYEVNHRLGSPVGVSKQITAVFDTAEFIGASVPEHHFAKMRETRFSVVFKDYVDIERMLGRVVFYADMYGNGDWCAVTSVGRVESKYGNETTAELQVTKYNEAIAYA